ncbi:type II toxin-antitoxin system prevent-host-death family antitoxin [Sulfitobacter sp. M57]|uniref:type II toxin-antitoxin system prevent-host-death family antitoxin n=1 Tax=Sulfitobacter sp. KE42 TaxID=2731155 RepID=UPI002A286231|nr:type II toxin-antitoxin system prevent-host-death family antitoxin [Sulfitobacter sp. KE5]MDF3423277.1 type II toxin-antitoxin system prevent-host-death family antitoxin [Sulfitobacter sp. KE43]MDF3434343.1 type II toxin-antitoxin system prevent-host-death family antitoxin [Sulfitobacter sp. KE42]MDF3459983.1 type II toxin-antitoxin system prevent-host-death family antitoxin [Sulfitobacter sp. S74]MDF3463881.1 type II toxin-antitoxin system prevent-host-death family antitoxin [Sulfitobacter 
MKVFSTTQLTRSTMEILEVAQCEPVTITRYGKPRFVLMLHEHFDAMQSAVCRANRGEETENPC